MRGNRLFFYCVSFHRNKSRFSERRWFQPWPSKVERSRCFNYFWRIPSFWESQYLSSKLATWPMMLDEPILLDSNSWIGVVYSEFLLWTKVRSGRGSAIVKFTYFHWNCLLIMKWFLFLMDSVYYSWTHDIVVLFQCWTWFWQKMQAVADGDCSTLV